MIDTNKIVFMGTPEFAGKALERLVTANFNVVGVITQPDKEVGRGKKVLSPQTKVIAEKHNIKVFQPTNKSELTDVVSSLKPDLIVVAAYGLIIPDQVLTLPKYQVLNIHASLLPKYRGGSCIAASILNGDKETGITIIKLTKELDAGPIISQVRLPILPTDTTATLFEKLATVGAEEIIRVIPLWTRGEIKETPQTNNEVSNCPLLTKNEGKIIWTEPGEIIERKIRAFTPWPGTFTFCKGKLLKIHQARLSDKKINPGQILARGNQLFVGTATTALEILELQAEGKQKTSAANYVNGHGDINGQILS